MSGSSGDGVPAAEESCSETTVLPIAHPIHMGGEEIFHDFIQKSCLFQPLKEFLCRDGVYIGKPDYVLHLLEKMIGDGAECFQVVTDFDRTLTRAHLDGKNCASSYGILEARMPKALYDYSMEVGRKYVTIEVDPNMTVEEKIPYMKEWWEKSHELFIQAGFKATDIGQMARDSSVHLRTHIDDFLTRLDEHRIPLLIYSAGIDNLIDAVLAYRTILPKLSLKPLVVANTMQFGDNGVVKGFGEELIHTFNKNEIFPHHLDYFLEHGHRKNVLLMGDMIGDLRMADGMRTKENVLTIGFLNSNIMDCFALYRDNFDIVLIDDQSLDIPLAILDAVAQS